MSCRIFLFLHDLFRKLQTFSYNMCSATGPLYLPWLFESMHAFVHPQSVLLMVMSRLLAQTTSILGEWRCALMAGGLLSVASSLVTEMPV